MTDSRRIVDLSHPLDTTTPAFPGDPRVEITVIDSTGPAEGATAVRALGGSEGGPRHVNVSRLAMSLHSGTHLDAPFHFIHGGDTVDAIAIARCVGPATLLRLDPPPNVIERAHLRTEETSLRRTRRLVIDSGWHRRWRAPDYFSAHPVLSGDAARFLVEIGVTLVGVDFPSVDRDPFPAHLELLGAGLLIVENLTGLGELGPGEFELHAVPLAISGRDGSPVRAFAIARDRS